MTVNPPGSPLARSAEIKRQGQALGFDAIGVASLERNAHAAELDRWLAAGYGGTMRYLHHGYKDGYENDYQTEVRTLLRE